MNLSKIENLNYVVQRNWENLPDISGYEDIDLLVADDHYYLLKEATKDWGIKVDIRTTKDGYYPVRLAELMLEGRRKYNGFWIPSPSGAFLGIYYHSLYHKPNNPYADKLKQLFRKWIPPVKPDDDGVKIYDID